MLKQLSSFLLLLILANYSQGQILPKNDSKLNYRIVGFTHPEIKKKEGNYTILISSGYFNNRDSFSKNIIISHACKGNKNIIEVPSFGTQYTWTISYEDYHRSHETTALYHFSTGYAPEIDTQQLRLNVFIHPKLYKDALVFFDGNKVLYDMNGKPVWYMPDLNGISNENKKISDLKITPFGTITFLLNAEAYEINIDGKIIWKGPNDGKISGDSLENYHHEFTRLSNGHYMTLGYQMRILTPDDSLHVSGLTKQLGYADLIEYDERGKIIWSWKSASYYLNSDFRYFYWKSPVNSDKLFVDPHENAFYFDERDSFIYISCKNISRILKIKYPEGRVVNAYGEQYLPGITPVDSGLFCHQHSCRRSSKGYLYFFNNNTCHIQPGIPKILITQEPSSGNELRVIWDYDFAQNGQFSPEVSGGGNVFELPGGEMFVCMGGQYSAAMIIDLSKQTQWIAMPEKWNDNTKKWEKVPQYRASIITDKDALEKLIFNSK